MSELERSLFHGVNLESVNKKIYMPTVERLNKWVSIEEKEEWNRVEKMIENVY